MRSESEERRRAEKIKEEMRYVNIIKHEENIKAYLRQINCDENIVDEVARETIKLLWENREKLKKFRRRQTLIYGVAKTTMERRIMSREQNV